MNRFEKWLLWGSSAATAVTGVVYAWMQYMMEPVNEWAAINHPWQPWVLKAHIVVAPFLVFAVGVIATGHIWKHYRSGAPMVVSGYLIQAVTHVGWLRALVWAHLITGGLYSVALVWHHLVFRRRRRIRERLGGARWEAVGKVSLGGTALEDDDEEEGAADPAPGSRDAAGRERGTGVATLEG